MNLAFWGSGFSPGSSSNVDCWMCHIQPFTFFLHYFTFLKKKFIDLLISVNGHYIQQSVQFFKKIKKKKRKNMDRCALQAQEAPDLNVDRWM